jgi:hypothetical protein
MLDYEKLPKSNVDHSHASGEGCKYLAVLVSSPESDVQKRLVWATGADTHHAIINDLMAEPPNDCKVRAHGGGWIKIDDGRKFIYLSGKSTNYGPDLYLESTMLAVREQFPGYIVMPK